MTGIAGSSLRAASGGEGFEPPSPASFELPPWAQVAGLDLTKTMLLTAISVVVIVGGTYLMSRKAAVVPSRAQFAGEMVYGFVRNSLARENIGSEHFMKFVPYLFSMFLFILLNNYWGIIPIAQFPTFSRIGFVVPLALIAWFTYIGVGIWKHGLFGYFKHATVPSGVSPAILPILIPLEFISNIIVRPFTLTLRLFGNMFAGHLLLILFATGGAALLASGNIAYAAVGVLSFVLGIGVSFLEVLVMFLQAYVFTLLTSMYIGEALADEH